MFFLGILFLINTVDSSIATANSGRIIQVGNSGMVGVGDGDDDNAEEPIGVAVRDGEGDKDGVGVGVGRLGA